MISLNGYQVEVTKFPDGTSQVWKIPAQHISDATNLIEWHFENEGEIMHLRQLNMLLNSMTDPSQGIELHMPFLPYGRQDKPIHNESTFAQIPFGMLIHEMGFSAVKTFDAHSNLGEKLIGDFESIAPTFPFLDDYDLVIFPDTGAFTRYGHLVKDKPVWVAEKVRDQATGYILSYHLDTNGWEMDRSSKAVVLDDLCDGGKTFEILGKTLRFADEDPNPCGEIGFLDTLPDLYVSHGVFSKGLETLLKFYGKIITTDTLNLDWLNWDEYGRPNSYIEKGELVVLPWRKA